VTSIGIGWDVASLPGLFQAGCHTVDHFRKAPLDLAPEHVAHARQLLSESAQQTTHVTLFPVVLLRHLEETTHSLERETPSVAEAGVKTRMHPLRILVDDLKREVLFVLEMMIEGALRGTRSRKQGLDAQIVVAMLEEHGQARIEQALLGWVHHLDYRPGRRVSPSPSRSCAR
jgi:hypothetical protein